MSTPEYRELLAEYREHLPKDRKRATQWTPELKRAHKRLLEYVKRHGGTENG
jgi:hypothetical protein